MLSDFQTSVVTASETAKALFEQERVSIDSFRKRGSFALRLRGGVYVVEDAAGVLYVGQTGRTLNARFFWTITDNHASKAWFERAQKLWFMPLSNATDRLLLELLLIVAYQPIFNKKPASRPIDLFGSI